MKLLQYSVKILNQKNGEDNIPVLYKYKSDNGHYALTSIRGQMITFQISPEGYTYLKESGVIIGKPFNRFLLFDCYRMGYAFTGHTGFEIQKGPGLFDSPNDTEPETIFPSCSVCNSPEDLHFVEKLNEKHSASILCGICRKMEQSIIDTSIPLPFVTRSVFNRLLTMKDIHDIDKSVLSYKKSLDIEFSEKWKALAESKKKSQVQKTLKFGKEPDKLL